jgi:hypothetical protein
MADTVVKNRNMFKFVTDKKKVFKLKLRCSLLCISTAGAGQSGISSTKWSPAMLKERFTKK